MPVTKVPLCDPQGCRRAGVLRIASLSPLGTPKPQEEARVRRVSPVNTALSAMRPSTERPDPSWRA